ncbi:MAG: dynamin family protein [Planctomycetaceae bacterium]|jgi:signal recognition particle receptor subunit beta|nr:dynamin family protein [Planctomycetaceae bacterium]
MKNKTNNKSVLLQCWSQFCEIAKTENRPELIERLEPEMKRFELGLFRIVVMGEIKKGKTSFINALLGTKNLLPVSSDIATSTVYKILYAPERKFKIFFQPDIDTGKRRDPLEISQEEIKNYGTEDGNPRNEKHVDFIGVEEPNPMLKEGIVIVDTPGVGGLFKQHREISWRYAPNADAIFFVLDSVESVISRDEIAFLKELKDRLKKQVFFVQTKIDAVDSEQSEGWRERNQNILEKELGISKDQIQYFPISSELKNVADESHDGTLFQESGFLTLLDFIHRGLKAKKDEILAAQIAVKLMLPLNEISTDLRSQQRLLQTKSQEELQKIQNDLNQAKAGFMKWENESFKKEMKTFSEKFQDVCRHCQNTIYADLNPSGRFVSQIIESIENLELPQLREQTETFQQDWMATASECLGELLNRFNQEVFLLSQDTIGKLGESSQKFGELLVQDFTKFDTVPFSGSKIQTNTMRTFDKTRNIFYGGAAGYAMATAAMGILTSVCPPAGGIAILAMTITPWLAAGIGVHQAHAGMQQQQRQQIFSQIQQQLQKLANQTQFHVKMFFEEKSINVNREIIQLFEQSMTNEKKRLETQIEQASRAIKISREENAKLVEEIKQRLSQTEHLQKLLTLIIPNKKQR